MDFLKYSTCLSAGLYLGHFKQFVGNNGET